MTIPTDATSVTSGQDGTVSVATSGSSTPTEVGTLQLAVFQNSSGLKAIGKNLLEETAASGSPTLQTPGLSGAGTIAQGFVENSNVNVSEELINMIVAQRSYEANSRVLSTTNEMMKSSNNV
jgi:flagellar basal-body rod protein FlgG